MPSRPMRHGQTIKSASAVRPQQKHLINRSKINLSQMPLMGQPSTSEAIGRYHAEKVHNLIQRPSK